MSWISASLVPLRIVPTAWITSHSKPSSPTRHRSCSLFIARPGSSTPWSMVARMKHASMFVDSPTAVRCCID
jgi:hypothetical protein